MDQGERATDREAGGSSHGPLATRGENRMRVAGPGAETWVDRAYRSGDP